MPKVGDFVVVRVLSVGGDCKLFVGKLLSGPDEEQDFEISYLERSRKIKYGFNFPQVEDLASISVNDIEKILPPPQSVGQTKHWHGTDGTKF